MPESIRRVRVTKTVIYQGPASWVEKCLAGSLKGTTCMNPAPSSESEAWRRDMSEYKFVIVETSEPTDELPVEGLQPDHTIKYPW
jgi:hypothetical protein